MDDWPEEHYPRDAKIDEAKDVLLRDLFGQRAEVFYNRQIAVLFERRFYHWITTKALIELAQERRVESTVEQLETEAGEEVIRFYWPRNVRYWRRQANEIRRLVEEFSSPDMMRALGLQGELLFDAAFAKFGWLHRGETVRAYRGREWTKTGHNLDRVFERDGLSYGVEIKNSLSYIERGELEIKLAMCEALALRPLFIMRAAPKSYTHMVNQAGGYLLTFEWQLYPYGREDLAQRVHDRLGLKVDTPRAIYEGTMKRLLDWHVRQVRGEARQ